MNCIPGYRKREFRDRPIGDGTGEDGRNICSWCSGSGRVKVRKKRGPRQ